MQSENERAAGTETAASESSSAELTDLLRGPADGAGTEEHQELSDNVTLEEEAGSAGASEEQANEEGSETAGGEEGESGFTLDEGDRDYSTGAYDRAAQHYSKLYGMELDPSNPAHHKLLHDLIANHHDTAARTTEETETGTAKEDADAEAEATAQAAATERDKPVTFTPEQRLENALRWGRQTYVPEIGGKLAQQFANLTARMMYPGEKFEDVQVDPKLAQEWTGMMMGMLGLGVGELMPTIMQSVPGAVKTGFPGIDRIHEMGVREAAMESVGEMRDAAGNLEFPQLEDLAESGALKKALKGIKGTFDPDPVKNLVEKIKIAAKLAASSRPNPNKLAEAARAGARSREAAQRRESSGRLRPGNSRGAFGTGQKDAATTLLEGMQSASRDRFGEAVREATAKK